MEFAENSALKVVAAYLKEDIGKIAVSLSKDDKKVDTKKPVRKITDDADVFLEVPIIRQGTAYSCGAATFLSVLGYYGHDPHEKQIMDAMGTTLSGTDPQAFFKVAKKFGLKAEIKEHMTVALIKEKIDKKIPVILDIQAWGEKKDKKNYDKEWKDGHYVVAIGYDKKGFYLMDPSQIGYSYLSYKGLENRWHDIMKDNKTKFYELGIAITGKEPKFNYNAVKVIG